MTSPFEIFVRKNLKKLSTKKKKQKKKTRSLKPYQRYNINTCRRKKTPHRDDSNNIRETTHAFSIQWSSSHNSVLYIYIYICSI